MEYQFIEGILLSIAEHYKYHIAIIENIVILKEKIRRTKLSKKDRSKIEHFEFWLAKVESISVEIKIREEKGSKSEILL